MRNVVATTLVSALAGLIPSVAAWPDPGTPDAVTAPAGFHVAAGLRVELFASEPLVRQPVTMSFDDRGRLWVVQYLQYPEPAGLKRVSGDRYDRIRYDRVPRPPPHGPKGADRVTILEDSDRDGRADRATDFVGGLNLASGLALGHGGVWVLQSPYLLFYPDGDRDDVPDSDPVVKLSGFGLEDAHSVANSLQWGPDGWLWGAHGSTVTANVRGVGFQQGLWRYHPRSDEFELFVEGGGNTYGLDFDEHGRTLVGTNRGDIGYHQVQGGYYVKTFGKHGPLRNPHAYGYFGGVRHSGANVGKLNVGGVQYRAAQWPEVFHGRWIVANPLNHAVYSLAIEDDGSTYRTRFDGRVVWSDDRWFQPVDMQLGSDGALWIADWYDSNINYQTTYRDREALDTARGRIYRIGAVDAKPRPPVDFSRAPTRALLEALDSDNASIVRRARRILVERGDSPELAVLETALHEGEPRAALEALWTLHGAGVLGVDGLRRCLSHSDQDIRGWAVRLLGDGRRAPPPVARSLIALAHSETSPRVRSQLASTAKRLDGDVALSIVAALLTHDEDAADRHIPLLLWWAIEAKAVSHRQDVLRLLDDGTVWRRPLVAGVVVRRLARRWAAEESAEGFAACAELLSRAPDTVCVDRVIAGMDEAFRGRSLDSIPPVLEERLSRLWMARKASPRLVRFALRLGSDSALKPALDIVRDGKHDDSTRIAVIDGLGETGREGAIETLAMLLVPSVPAAVRAAAVRALGRFDADRIAARVLASYSSMDVAVRAAARSALISRAAWARRLLRAVDDGRVPASDLSLVDLRQILAHGDKAVSEKIEARWGRVRTATPAEAQKRVESIARILGGGQGDIFRGRPVFEKICGRCHVLHGEGKKIGPDLTPYPRDDIDSMLISIVDPSAIVRPEYAVQVVTTRDSRVLTGLLAESTPTTITILDANDQRTVVARDDVATRTTADESLMPARLLAELDERAIRDLFAYLRRRDR